LTRSVDIYKFNAMFVSVCCDLSSSDHEQSVAVLLKQYGFAKVQADVYEHTSINDEYVKRLKRDIDRLTDSYDTVRIYQYPLENTLQISTLKDKKWRKLIVRA
jgi:CRISPR-associated protein Cas2